jgi:hypothetical protein
LVAELTVEMATSNNYKIPPQFDPKKMTYETWKNEIEVWKYVADIDEKNKHWQFHCHCQAMPERQQWIYLPRT